MVRNDKHVSDGEIAMASPMRRLGTRIFSWLDVRVTSTSPDHVG